jgi:Tfp pilus assembly protein PilV
MSTISTSGSLGWLIAAQVAQTDWLSGAASASSSDAADWMNPNPSSSSPGDAFATAFATSKNSQSSGELSLIENEYKARISAAASASTQSVNKLA